MEKIKNLLIPKMRQDSLFSPGWPCGKTDTGCCSRCKGRLPPDFEAESLHPAILCGLPPTGQAGTSPAPFPFQGNPHSPLRIPAGKYGLLPR